MPFILKFKSIIPIIFISLPLSGRSMDLINLECKIFQTISLKDGTASPTSGVEHIQITRNADGSYTIARNNVEKYAGSADENFFRGSAQYEFSGLKMTESILINRYTGQFEIDLKSIRDPGIRHIGMCNSVSKKF